MNGKAIIVDNIFGIYQVKIVDFDKGASIERYEGGLTRNKAFEIAALWSKETLYPVRIQNGNQLSLAEKRDITNHKITKS